MKFLIILILLSSCSSQNYKKSEYDRGYSYGVESGCIYGSINVMNKIDHEVKKALEPDFDKFMFDCELEKGHVYETLKRQNEIQND